MEIKSIEIHKIGEINKGEHYLKQTISRAEIIIKVDKYDTSSLFNQIIESVLCFNFDEHFSMNEEIFKKLETEEFYRIEYIENSCNFKLTKIKELKSIETIDL